MPDWRSLYYTNRRALLESEFTSLPLLARAAVYSNFLQAARNVTSYWNDPINGGGWNYGGASPLETTHYYNGSAAQGPRQITRQWGFDSRFDQIGGDVFIGSTGASNRPDYIDGASGWGTEARIRDAEQYFNEILKPYLDASSNAIDRISLVGYSQGATDVALLAPFVGKYLLDNGLSGSITINIFYLAPNIDINNVEGTLRNRFGADLDISVSAGTVIKRPHDAITDGVYTAGTDGDLTRLSNTGQIDLLPELVTLNEKVFYPLNPNSLNSERRLNLSSGSAETHDIGLIVSDLVAGNLNIDDQLAVRKSDGTIEYMSNYAFNQFILDKIDSGVRVYIDGVDQTDNLIQGISNDPFNWTGTSESVKNGDTHLFHTNSFPKISSKDDFPAPAFGITCLNGTPGSHRPSGASPSCDAAG